MSDEFPFDEERCLMRVALESDNPTVVAAREALYVVTRLAEGEEVRKEIDVSKRMRQHIYNAQQRKPNDTYLFLQLAMVSCDPGVRLALDNLIEVVEDDVRKI